VGVADPYLGEDLVAFVVPRPGATCRLAELSLLCERTLGAFKVPRRIHLRDELPRAPTGKVQRHLLVEPADGRPATSVGRSRPAPGPAPPSHVPPRTPIEAAIVAAWREALGRDRVGVHDDFFALGGGSLAAVRVLARLSRVLPVGLSFGAFLEHPTAAEQALLVADQLLGPDGDEGRRLLDEVEALSEQDAARRLADADAPPGPTA
jgi:hypothetical protein